MKHIILTTSLLMFFIGTAFSQDCSCSEDFDFLVNKVQNDYPGYHDKVNADNLDELKSLESAIRKKICNAPDSCHYYLREYTDWFNDYHLRIHDYRPRTASGFYGKMMFIDIDTCSIPTNNNGIEGEWMTYQGRILIVKTGAESYAGVSIDYPRYDRNQIMYQFFETDSGFFDVKVYSKFTRYVPYDEKASLHVKNKVLEVHGHTKFVKVTSQPKTDMALLRSYIMVNPNGLNTYTVAMPLNDSTFYLRIPSFGSDHSEDIVKKYWKEIVSRPNLIIDIRNNSGGQDIYYQTLLSLVHSGSYTSKGVDWYASAGNIEFYEDALQNGRIKDGDDSYEWTFRLIEAMKQDSGRFVQHPLMGHDKTIIPDTIYPYPRNIGIIINENNASSAEQFILSARNSEKVVLFGNQNTLGVLDYSNAVQIQLPSREIRLTYPLTRSRRLPEEGIDNVGIPPDVIIPLEPQVQLYNRLDDWVYFVLMYLESN